MKYGEISKLRDIARAEIENLEAAGVTLTASEIIKINAIAHVIENPQTRLDLSRGTPVFVGGVALWPLTLYGSNWYQRVCKTITGTRAQLRALAFAMAHGRDDALDFPDFEASRRVKEWINALRCRNEEIEEAITQALAQDEHPAESESVDLSKLPTHGDLSVELAALCGGSVKQWEQQCSIPYVLGVIRAIRAQNEESGKSTRDDEKMRAEKAMGSLIAGIMRRHEQRQAVSHV